ncbi:MAG: hypothetical protein RR477_04875, partial [Raoultibacter sp.]
YVVNHSLKEYIDEMAAPFCADISSKDDVMGARIDPLPYLLAPNTYNIDDEVAGRWCPGAIEAANAEPPSGYVNITRVAIAALPFIFRL